MANEEHLRILRSGVKEWNKWRKVNPKVVPNLSRVRLTSADLHVEYKDEWTVYADFSGANLKSVDLSGEQIGRVDLIGANCSNANFQGAELDGTYLSAANLTKADLMFAHLRNVKLAGCDMTDASVGWATFVEVSLAAAKLPSGERNVKACSIDVATLERTAAELSRDPSNTQRVLSFLEEAGVPTNYIEFFRSRIGQPIKYYSCFISYSSKDEGFVDLLYADLRQVNIRCWRDKEDLKIGQKLRQSINDAIRLHDKLIVVLSEHSVNSIWVEDEVETAFEKERKEGGTALFPIRLDEAVMDSNAGWASKIRTRHIGDFRRWKDHDEYQKALERLIGDLQADAPPSER